MTQQDMVTILNDILRHERKHFMFYQHATYMTRTVMRLILNPFWEKEMQGELEHMKLFADKIVALGGVPTLEYHEFPTTVFDNPMHTLQYAAHMEQEVLTLYHTVYPKAQEYADEHGDMSIALLLEENIEDSTADLEEIKKLIAVS